MSRFGNTDYDATSNTNNDDYKDRDSLLMGRYAILTMTLDRVGVYPGNYGQNLILNMDDVRVVEGVTGQRLDDGKIKVFGWDKWFDRDDETMELQPLPGQEEVSEEALPSVESTSAGNDTYRYNIEETVMESQDEPVSIGDLELWLGNGKKARTLAKVFSEYGHDIINDDNKQEDYGWLNAESDDEFNFRDDLQGRRIMFWFENKTISADELDADQEKDVTFTDSVVLDAETEVPIKISNDGDTLENGTSETSPAAGTESTSASTEMTGNGNSETVNGDGEFPERVESLIEMFSRTNQDNRESIAGMIEEAAPNDYTVDMDNVMAAIESGS